MFRTEIDDCVPFLNEYYPGWVDTIDLDSLDMVRTRHCILGQLTGDFWKTVSDRWHSGAHAANSITRDKANALGLALPDNDCNRYEKLTAEWKERIRAIRAANQALADAPGAEWIDPVCGHPRSPDVARDVPCPDPVCVRQRELADDYQRNVVDRTEADAAAVAAHRMAHSVTTFYNGSTPPLPTGVAPVAADGCGKFTGRASNRCLLTLGHEGKCDDDPQQQASPPLMTRELFDGLCRRLNLNMAQTFELFESLSTQHFVDFS